MAWYLIVKFTGEINSVDFHPLDLLSIPAQLHKKGEIILGDVILSCDDEQL